MAKRCYYESLTIERTASDGDVKSAFRKHAMQCHPDRNPGDKEAEHRFKEINEAYEVLKDPDKRAAYDRFGHAAFEHGGGEFLGQRGLTQHHVIEAGPIGIFSNSQARSGVPLRIAVDHENLKIASGKRSCQVDSCSGLPNPAFLVGNGKYSAQVAMLARSSIPTPPSACFTWNQRLTARCFT